MASIFKEFGTKLRIDYQEWRLYLISIWNVKRDNRLVKRAVHRAVLKNSDDRRTYYILRDRAGGINELNKTEINFFTQKGIFVKMSHMQLLQASIKIITKNSQVQEDFNQIQLKKEGNNE